MEQGMSVYTEEDRCEILAHFGFDPVNVPAYEHCIYNNVSPEKAISDDYVRRDPDIKYSFVWSAIVYVSGFLLGNTTIPFIGCALFIYWLYVFYAIRRSYIREFKWQIGNYCKYKIIHGIKSYYNLKPTIEDEQDRFI